MSRNKYRALRGLIPYIELGFGAYFSYVLVLAIDQKQWSMVPFVMIFQGGFLYVALMSLLQTPWRSLRQSAHPELLAAGA